MRADEINSVYSQEAPDVAEEVWERSHVPFSSNCNYMATNGRFHPKQCNFRKYECEQMKLTVYIANSHQMLLKKFGNGPTCHFRVIVITWQPMADFTQNSITSANMNPSCLHKRCSSDLGPRCC